ncbi:hypothetical protein IMY05_008G0090100 [Salix suchowensis]|nr:hypothetical protein IMY05_008G0090100 [Salix suchowensis]
MRSAPLPLNHPPLLAVKILLNPNRGMYTHLLLFDLFTLRYQFIFLLALFN